MKERSRQRPEIGTSRARRHWHPVLLAKDLKDAPVSVSVLGAPMVVSRTRFGLSAGRCFDAVEHHGIVWVRERGSNAPLPAIDAGGRYFIGHDTGIINAPFYIVVDNFTEVEHSPMNHFLLGFDEEGILSVEPKLEVRSDSLHITVAGPQREIPWWTFGRVVGVKKGLRLVIDFTVRFDPLAWVYDLSWADPKTGKKLPQNLRLCAFITPRDDKSTSVFFLHYSSIHLFSPRNPLASVLKRLYLRTVNHELELDRKICENVAEMNPGPSLEGFQLGKFDRPLPLTRKLIRSVYDGPTAERALEAAE